VRIPFRIVATLGVFLLVPAASLAHGPGHSAAPGPTPIVDRGGERIPVYLLAAVCGMPGREGDPGFERRVELARFLVAKAETKPAAAERRPLFEGLGKHHRAVTTSNDLAQRYFDQGLRLAFAFNFPEALVAFREARRIDPDCAMCFWGEAWVLGPNINAPMDPEAVAPALRAVELASENATGTSETEKALIAALRQRYSAEEGAERTELDRDYAEAMARVAERFPKDVDIQVLYAEALMNRRPWDYWEADGETLRPEVRDLTASLERALELDPEHPYAIHLYIHTVEASTTPERAEAHAERLAALAPAAGHLVHMPSHIYFRVGRFRDSVATNRKAVAADEAYLERAGVESPYRYSYYPHNVHFLLESARMTGDAETTLAAAEKLPDITSDEVSAEIPWVQLIDAAPYFAHAQFSAPATILALSDPGDRLPFVKVAWHYARGVAHAEGGDAKAARAEVDAIGKLAEEHDWSGMIEGGVPVPDLLALASHVITGRIARATGDPEAAVRAFQRAVAIQDALPYLEPPYWYYPVRQSLGAALLEAGRAEEAQAVFRKGLDAHPNHAWLLYGLYRAQAARGDADGAAATRERFEAAWQGEPGGPDLSRL
jgi:tetratricopeptide (TPR) repeat protein